MESVFDCVKAFCLTQNIKKNIFWVAYSGGLDSHVLLHVCAQLRDQYNLPFKAIHINHGLSPQADLWANHCKMVCEDLKIELLTKNIAVLIKKGDSLEALARTLRYQAFNECINASDVLLTAHHQEDQAETLFLQLMRGAGLKGLSAMPPMKAIKHGLHGRPLLDISKDAIQCYAKLHQLRWIEDESNGNLDFNRNFLRHTVFPLLKTRWPSVHNTLARAAAHCADAQYSLDLMMDEHLNHVRVDKGLSIPGLLALSPAIQRHVLRKWFADLDFPIPSVVKMQQIQYSLLLASEDKSPHVSWGSVEVRRYKNVLYAMQNLLIHDSKKNYKWNLKEDLLLPNLGRLHSELVMGYGLREDIKEVTVRFRQGGEFCRLPERDFHHDLKKLFQQWDVPPWERSRIPLLFVEGKLVSVVGFHIDPDYIATPCDMGRIISLT